MTFQVYYRKWRPQRFSELVGQEHVSTTLRQAVQQGRVAHSYLFCGPRGTGKTSTARVLAKSVNCLGPQDSDPCTTCSRCQAIYEARFMDLIELDAASNRGIDEIRNIRDKVNLAPVEGGYKVYIIDEAHMLTEHASNAFLKTLEEPPPHAIFILCTTEPHKILPTIISRCQRFDFRRITAEAIIERLRKICHEEGVGVESEALAALARAAGGSLRDAENLLEQLVVSYGNQVGMDQVSDLLGLGHGEMALELTRFLLLGDATAALEVINRGAWEGVDLRQLHRQAVDLLRAALLIRYGARGSINLPQELVQELEGLAPRSSIPRLVKTLKLLGEVNTRFDPSSPLPLELAVVEACTEATHQEPPAYSGPPPATVPATVPAPQRRAQTPPAESARAPASAGPVPARRPPPGTGEPEEAAVPAVASSPAPPQQARPADATEGMNPAEGEPVTEMATPQPAPASSNSDAGGALEEQWSTIVKNLSRYKGKRFNIGALLRDCKSQHLEGETLVLAFAHRSHLERMQEELEDPQGIRTVNEVLLKSLGTAYQVRLTLDGENGSSRSPSPGQSPLVRAALAMGARIVEEREP